MNKLRRLFTACLALLPLLAAAADTTALDGYLAGLSTWSGNFTQSVEDAQARQLGQGSGRLLIVRPGKFRWESSPAGAASAAQLLVADGRNLWFLDRDLDQATVKPLSEALPQSPAMLLAGGAELRAAFSVQPNGRRDGMEWVRVLPKDAASDFREALFGFKGRELARLVIVDKLGQRSTLVFNAVRRNAPVDPALTEFVLPPGVDLIGKPVQP
ncbi:MAG: outer membrane lipoprotein chaperone LolA [Steroidobacteraceae bacterium]